MTTLSLLETAWGWLGMASTEHGVRGLTLPEATSDRALAAIAGDFPAATLGEQPNSDDVNKQLLRFFEGDPIVFRVPLDLPPRPAFWRSVWETVATIPYGETRSYGAVARQTGVAGAARAVGAAMAHNPVPIIIPCHRVVGSNGSLTGFGGGLEMKRKLLDMERLGVTKLQRVR